MGSDESHFNVSLIVRTKLQDSVHKPHLFEIKRRPEAKSSRGPINVIIIVKSSMGRVRDSSLKVLWHMYDRLLTLTRMGRVIETPR